MTQTTTAQTTALPDTAQPTGAPKPANVDRAAMTVRPATWGDKTVLLEMIHSLAKHHGDAATLDLHALVHLLKADMPWLKLVVAERDGEVVGYAGLTGGMRLQFGQRVMDLHHLYVRHAHRGLGVGRVLIAAANDMAKDMGCARITVGTNDTNTDAKAAYIACGFTPVPMTGQRFSMDVA